jgi:hypothetical protein
MPIVILLGLSNQTSRIQRFRDNSRPRFAFLARNPAAVNRMRIAL